MAWTEKRGSRYLVRWREPGGGRVVSRSFDHSSDARTYRHEVERSLDRHEYVPAELRSTPFSSYFAATLRGSLYLQPSTRYQYELIANKHILPRIGTRAIGDLAEHDLRKLFAELQGAGTGASVLGRVRRVLSRVFEQALREGILVRNPIKGIQPPRESHPELKILKPAEIRLLADAISPRFRAMVLLAGYGGLRIGELGALGIQHLNISRGRLEVTQALQTARGEVRVAPPKSRAGNRVVSIPGFVAQALMEHLASWPPTEDGRIFSLEGGGLVSHQTFWPYWQKVRKATGINARFHDLRHTAVALAIEQGAHLKQIQSRIGHANIQMTLDRYGHLFPGMDEDLADRMNQAYASDGEVMT